MAWLNAPSSTSNSGERPSAKKKLNRTASTVSTQNGLDDGLRGMWDGQFAGHDGVGQAAAQARSLRGAAVAPYSTRPVRAQPAARGLSC